MIAGEFAVLEPYQQLSVVAVNRYVYATLKDSDENKLHLTDFQLENLRFEFSNHKLHIHTADSRVSFIRNAMEVTYRYLSEKKYPVSPFSLLIKSELDDKSGIKYGLGSSAAVVTSVVAAILHKFLPNEPSKELLFKLASISHVITQGNGSGADVAASSYGGLLNYASFQAEWLQREYEQTESISELVEKNWKYLTLEPISIPENTYFCVGWTGNPASTKKLVDIVLQLKNDNPPRFEEFLDRSKHAVETFLHGMEVSDFNILSRGIKENRQALRTVGDYANAPIETPLLTKLCDVAEKNGGAGKPSGAGGGDCGIAFMPSKERVEKLLEDWEREGIKPLSIQPSRTGAIILPKSV